MTSDAIKLKFLWYEHRKNFKKAADRLAFLEGMLDYMFLGEMPEKTEATEDMSDIEAARIAGFRYIFPYMERSKTNRANGSIGGKATISGIVRRRDGMSARPIVNRSAGVVPTTVQRPVVAATQIDKSEYNTPADAESVVMKIRQRQLQKPDKFITEDVVDKFITYLESVHWSDSKGNPISVGGILKTFYWWLDIEKKQARREEERERREREERDEAERHMWAQNRVNLSDYDD